MTKVMLIDAVHPEEVRVAVVDRGQVEDFDFESAKKRQLRGNIYLAKVTRVEPSLQAAFVDFGGNRHGFLAFSEIHPDYYQLPQSDRDALIADTTPDADSVDVDDSEEDEGEERVRSRSSAQKNYKIQEVIRRRQIMLVQAVKEERGTKGAALTTYLSLAGRYCVLMPNTPSGGGISRKITNAADRKRLKSIVAELNVPEGMGLIVRTAGAKRTKTEIKRDFEYLIRLWSKIRELTLSSVAPCLINAEAGLVHRALRDLYDKDIEQVVVDGEAAYREAKDLAKMLMPSHAKKVQHHKEGAPVFAAHQIESQLDNIYSPVVNLKSGGYLVIHQTEALVAIDVNSGKSTRERNIEQTALRTNLEAAEEACRQMRLRDLAGLVVIDFIDMEENKNNRAVERKMKDCLKHDRARVQYNKISMFGLMEISRQRRRAGVLDTSSDPCDHCAGTGHVRSIESSALQLLRALENRCAGMNGGNVEASAPTDVVLFLLNEKRQYLAEIETRHNLSLQIHARADLRNGDFDIRVEDLEGRVIEPPKPKPIRYPKPEPERASHKHSRDDDDDDDSNLAILDDPMDDDETDGPVSLVEAAEDDKDDSNSSRKRRRRGRRGGRRRRKEQTATIIELSEETVTTDGGAVLDAAAADVKALVGEDISIVATPIIVEAVEETPAVTENDAPAETSDTPVVEAVEEAAEVVAEAEPEAKAPDAPTEAVEPVATPEPEAVEAAVEVVEEAAKETVEAEPELVSETVAPVAEAAPEPQEAEIPLPETEKPKNIRKGWWQRKSAN